MEDSKKSVSEIFAVSDRKIGVSKTIEVEVDKPLGLTLGQKQGGGVVITVSFFTTSSGILYVYMLFNIVLRIF